MTRVLVSGDWHSDTITAGVPRFSDITNAATELVLVARRMRCDVFLFLGDLCNPDTPRAFRSSQLATSIARELVETRIASVWLTGNHDVIEDGHGSHTLLGLKAWEHELDAVVCDSPREVKLDGVTILALPYVARSHGYDPAKEVEAFAQMHGDSPNVIVAGHLMLQGIGVGSEVTDFARGRDIFYPVAECQRLLPSATLVNGHYHAQQTYQGVHMPGTLARLTKGDVAQQPGYIIIEVGS